jgi:hypothetical protein
MELEVCSNVFPIPRWIVSANRICVFIAGTMRAAAKHRPRESNKEEKRKLYIFVLFSEKNTKDNL